MVTSQRTTAQPQDNARARYDRLFYSGASLAMALALVIGFSRNYYLSYWLDPLPGAPEMTSRLHIHGAIATAWVLLAVVQPLLIAAGNRRLHRTLGMCALVLIPAMTVLLFEASYTAMMQQRAPLGAPVTIFFGFNAISAVNFAVAASLAIMWRRDAGWHKRLIMLSWVPLLPPGFGRMPALVSSAPISMLFGANLIILLGILYDKWSRGSLHPAWKWGGTLMVLSQFIALTGSGSAPWQAAVAALQSP